LLDPETGLEFEIWKVTDPSTGIYLSTKWTFHSQIPGYYRGGCGEYEYELQKDPPQRHCPRKMGSGICSQWSCHKLNEKLKEL